jgi:hypothetical protein
MVEGMTRIMIGCHFAVAVNQAWGDYGTWLALIMPSIDWCDMEELIYIVHIACATFPKQREPEGF